MKTRFEVSISDSLPSFDQGLWDLYKAPGSDTGSNAGYEEGSNSASTAG